MKLATLRRTAGAAVIALALSGAATASADAAIAVNDNTPFNGQTLTATITSPPSGATKYTLAECNVTSTPANWGRDCNRADAVGFTPIATTSVSITVRSSFANASFVPGLSPQYGASTTCRGAATNSPCAVVVSYYNAANVPVGTAQKADLTF